MRINRDRCSNPWWAGLPTGEHLPAGVRFDAASKGRHPERRDECEACGDGAACKRALQRHDQPQPQLGAEAGEAGPFEGGGREPSRSAKARRKNRAHDRDADRTPDAACEQIE